MDRTRTHENSSGLVRPVRQLAVLAAGLWLAGCDPATLPHETTEQNLTHVESRNGVQLQLRVCAPTAETQYAYTTCSIDTDFVLVGGGAQIGMTDPQAGALLTASRPRSEDHVDVWEVASRDREREDYHTLTAWAVGLKLEGVSRATLLRYMQYRETRARSWTETTVDAVLDPQYTLIGGGGGRIYMQRPSSQTMNGSYPQGDGRTWRVELVAESYDPNVLTTAWAIGIDTNSHIPNFGRLAVKELKSERKRIEGGHATASVLAESGWLLTSVGGLSESDDSTWPRYIHELIPRATVSIVKDKDHIQSNSGYLTGHGIQIQRR